MLLNSNKIKSKAFYNVALPYGEKFAQALLTYHIKNGGVSRFEKIRAFYKDILQRPLSDKRFQELVLRFSKLVIDEVVAAPWVEGAREFLSQNKKQYNCERTDDLSSTQ